MVGQPHQVVLLRHGETEWSASGQHTSVTDIPLTDRGREQAVAVGRAIAGRRFARVLTSPMERARETCRLAELGDRAEVTTDLEEWRYGEYEGRTTPEIREHDPGWTIWPAGAPGGETPDQVAARADRLLASLDGVDGDVALVGHGHMLRVVAARWLGLSASDGRLLKLGTGTVSTLGWEHETRAVEAWNVPAPLPD
jgi:broad specificity phosphatase PhoE